MARIESLRTEQKFKKTEAGEIPVEWEAANLDNILELNYGDGLPEEKRKKGIFSVYGSNGVIGYHYAALVKGPGIIIGRKGTIGSVEWSEKDFWPIDTTYYVSSNNEKVNSRWLYYQLQILKLNKLNTATGIPGLNREAALNESVPYPPISEQKKIAEILSGVDNAIEKSSQFIEKKKELKKGLMQELLARGIGHKKFCKTKIGDIPEGWEIVQLKKVGKIITGSTPRTEIKDYFNGRYMFVTPFDMEDFKYVKKTARMLSEKGMSVSRRLPKDAVMVTCIASIGKIGMATEECSTNQQINSIICNNDVDPHFIYYIMLYKVNFLRMLAGQTAVPIVKKSLFENIFIPFPPFREQKRIAEIVSGVDNDIEEETNEKSKLEQLKKGLMQALLTGKVRVKI